MSIEALKGLDVGRIAHRDAALFMWATDAHIPDALELYRAWGFRYVTVAFVWSKKTINGKTVSNLAPWTLKNCELCLMGTRGRMVQYKQRNNVPQLVEAVRTRHSEKPEEVRRSIEALFGDVPGSSSLPDAAPPAGTIGETRCKSWQQQQRAAGGSSPPSAPYGRSPSRRSWGSRTKTSTGSCTGRRAKGA